MGAQRRFATWIAGSDVDPYAQLGATRLFLIVRMGEQLVRATPAKFQPIAANDVAAFVTEAALADPLNGRIEIAGPDKIGLDALLRIVLETDGDARSVVTDAHARYFGAEPTDTSLVPGGPARLGETRLADWLATHPATG